MENGFKIIWTEHALKELAATFAYLEENFTKKELRTLSLEIEKTLKSISKFPQLFPISKHNGVRKVVIKKFNTLYYREKNDVIEIISFFSNRQSPYRFEV